MHESDKTNKLRSEHFKSLYLRGRIIDIGAGSDPVCHSAEVFDREDGDANIITRFRETGAYDCVHSSHCLEHMGDPRSALSEWWDLIRPGGHLVLVVPEESLYEQGYWPSLFNPDHKFTFRLDRPSSWSPVSWEIRQLVSDLPGCDVLEAEIQDAGYDYSLLPPVHSHGRLRHWMSRFMARIRGRALRMRTPNRILNLAILRSCRALALPVDQTLTTAVAQIQIVARKREAASL